MKKADVRTYTLPTENKNNFRVNYKTHWGCLTDLEKAYGQTVEEWRNLTNTHENIAKLARHRYVSVDSFFQTWTSSKGKEVWAHKEIWFSFFFYCDNSKLMLIRKFLNKLEGLVN